MKKYRLNSNISEQMNYEEARDYLQENLGFKLDSTFNLKTIANQNEMIEVLIETYFTVEEVEENEGCYEDDLKEREIEYRKVQGF